MPATVLDFRTRFTEYSEELEYSDERIQMFLDDAELFMGEDEDHWCGYYTIAQSYLSAHYLHLATASEYGDSSANVGPISSKSAGGVSVGRAYVAQSMSNSDSYLMSTSYGLRYIDIRDRTFVGVIVLC